MLQEAVEIKYAQETHHTIAAHVELTYVTIKGDSLVSEVFQEMTKPYLSNVLKYHLSRTLFSDIEHALTSVRDERVSKISEKKKRYLGYLVSRLNNMLIEAYNSGNILNATASREFDEAARIYRKPRSVSATNPYDILMLIATDGRVPRAPVHM